MSGNNDAASDSRFLSCISFQGLEEQLRHVLALEGRGVAERGDQLPTERQSDLESSAGPWNIRGEAGGYRLVEPDVL